MDDRDDTQSRWAVLGRVILFLFSCALLVAVASPIAKRIALAPEVTVGVLAGLGAFALTLLFARWDRVSLSDTGAAFRPDSRARLVLGFVAGLLLVALWALIWSGVAGVRWLRVPGNHSVAALVALTGYVALACREELAFRGYPLRRLDRCFGLVFAQLFVALVFAAEHRLGGSGWFDALAGVGVASLLFGMAAIATRGLAVPIGLHAAWNFGQWSLGLRGGSGFWTSIERERP
jgi:membrane protease YdiL (CAAX protease family)